MQRMMTSWNAPPRTLVVKPGMIDAWGMTLLAEDCANVLQVETPEGYLIKVVPIEQDLGGQPTDLRDFLQEARRTHRDWLLVQTMPTPVIPTLMQ